MKKAPQRLLDDFLHTTILRKPTPNQGYDRLSRLPYYTIKKGKKKMNIAYVRVSTIDQNPGRQYEDLKKYDIDKWFEEKASGKDTKRPVLNEMLSFARDGDTIYIESFSRLARNTADLLKIIDDLKKKNVKIISQKENLDSDTPTGKMMITMIGAIATFERELILERQREGIELAKRAGKYKKVGRTAMEMPANFKDLYELYMMRRIKTKGELAKRCKCSRPILERFIEEYQKTKTERT